MIRQFHFKMNEADPAPADGGGAGGGILNSAPAEGAPAEGAPAEYVAPEWLTGVDAEYANSDIMKNVPDLPTLAKNYVHAQRMVGSDKVALPSKHATQDEWRQFFNKAGLPETIDDYEIKADNADADDLAAFKQKSFELGLMPHQAEELYRAQQEAYNAEDASNQAEYEQIIEETTAELKAEYGQAFPQKIELANKFLDEVADEDMRQYIQESGLDNDGVFIRMLVNAATKFGGEDSFDVKTNPIGTLSPTEAQSQINMIYGDENHPYNNPSHPNHANATAEMTKLFGFTVS